MRLNFNMCEDCNNNNFKLALLDYDGFVCKAFYASLSKSRENNDPEEILHKLVSSAIEKTANYFDTDLVIPVKVMSGHTFKKDLYPTYKSKRKRNEDLGAFREYIKASDDDIVIVDLLEADDVLYNLFQRYSEDSIVFSDDKDLKYYCQVHCKINITEEIENKKYEKELFEQLLAGDKEDSIDGIPSVGMVSARQILSSTGYYLEDVIRAYKSKEVSEDDCIKNIVLITPVILNFNVDDEILKSKKIDDAIVINSIINHCMSIANRVGRIYAKAN